MEDSREYVDPNQPQPQPSRSEALLQDVKAMAMDHGPPVVPQFRRTVPLRHFTAEWQPASVKAVKLQKKAAALAAARAAYSQVGTSRVVTALESKPVREWGFHFLPRELRNEIYPMILSGVWNGKTPPFIIALRGDKELYEEALGFFYATNTFRLTKNNRWMSMRVPRHEMTSSLPAVLTITSLVIELPLIKKNHAFKFQQIAQAIIIDCVAFLKAAQNVRTLELIFHSCVHHLLHDNLIRLICWFVNVSQIRTLRCTYSAPSMFYNGHEIDFTHRRLGRRLGVNACPLSCPTDDAPSTWQWKAVGRKYLMYDSLFLRPYEIAGFYAVVRNLDAIFVLDNPGLGFENHEKSADELAGFELAMQEHDRHGFLKKLYMKLKARFASCRKIKHST